MNEESLFAAALDKSSATEQRAFLAEACGGDTDLRDRVERLLAADRQTQGILERGPGIGGVPQPEPLAAGRTFAGRYTLRRKLGEGGMGEVWVADQSEPVRRSVALKVVRCGFDSARLLARFEQERQALALMDHPNIAKVLDGGVTEDGRPYFVMELIEGVTVTEYCDAARLSPRERLELFAPICRAVQHAHQKGVIHRDLKPSNLLVALYDGKPVPKVIDFGVAKATGPRLTERGVCTEAGSLIGTLEYMSPEQAELNNLDVDTRSDVYALGVVLYELLTGRVPFSREELSALPLSEALRVIREVDPPKPSGRRGGTAGPRTPRWDELDWIVMKCLEKDRARRYETADGLASDVNRYLTDEVVTARPPSTGYRVRKFIRRNKGKVVAALALATTFAVGLGGVAAVQIAADRDRTAAATDRAVREATATAGATAALRDAHERGEEAWGLHDHPDRMQRATDAAIAAIRRADDIVAAGPVSEPALADLATARQRVAELVRATRLTATLTDSRLDYADRTLDERDAQKTMRELCARHAAALRQFGLDPTAGSVDEVARAVATSRIRDPLLGILLEWSHYAHIVSRAGGKEEAAVRERLGQVTRTTRQLCGGAYARWQTLIERQDLKGLIAFAGSPDGRGLGPPLALALARDFQTKGRLAECRAVLRAAVERYPDDVLLHYDLGAACQAVQPPDHAEAIRHFAAASALRPDNVGFHLSLGTSYSGLWLRDQAVAEFQKALSLRPKSGYAISAMKGAVSILDGRPEFYPWLEGKWERVTATEGAPYRDAVRVELEHKRNKLTVFSYYTKDQLLGSYEVAMRKERHGSVEGLSCRVVRILAGPENLRRAETTIYQVSKHSFYEVGGVVAGEGADRPKPYLARWVWGRE